MSCAERYVGGVTTTESHRATSAWFRAPTCGRPSAPFGVTFAAAASTRWPPARPQPGHGHNDERARARPTATGERQRTIAPDVANMLNWRLLIPREDHCDARLELFGPITP